MRYAPLFRSSALALFLCLIAQHAVAQGGAEHQYTLFMHGVESGMQEKILTETIIGFDPEARVAIDREEHLMAVRSRQELDIPAIQEMVSQWGITFTVRERSDRDGALHNAQ